MAALAMVAAVTAAFGPTPAHALDWTLPASTLSQTFANTPNQQVAVGADGTTTVVWRENNGLNDIIRASTRGPGGSWPNPATAGAVESLSASGFDSDSPQVAIGADGTATAVWTIYDGAAYIVQAATRSPGQASFGPAENLSQSGQSAAGPQVAIAPDGTTTVIWRRSNGSNSIVQAATRQAGQGTFGAVQDLSQAGRSAFLHQVATGASGATVVVWSRSDGTSPVIQAASRAPGEASFGTPETLSQTGQSAGDPQAAIAGDGTTVVTWRRSNGSNLIIQAAVRASGQTAFGTAQNLSAAGLDAVVPQVAAAPDGTTTVTWNGSNGTNLVVWAATLQAGQASFGAPEVLSANGQSSFDQQVAVAPDGATTVTWTRTNGSDVVMQATTRPAGGAWPDPNSPGSVTDLSEAGANGQYPQIGVAGDGSFTVAWQFYSAGTGGNNVVQAATSGSTSYPLTVTRGGAGFGTVTSAPAGIDCGATCSASFPLSSKVTLTATAASGSSFTGWGGSCSGSGATCTVTILGTRSATATFSSNPAPAPSNQFRLGSSRVIGNAIRTRVSLPGAGRLTQAGTFRTRSSSTRSAAATRTACRATPARVSGQATVTENCRLTTAARSARKKGAVSVRLCTTFVPTGGTARTTCRTVRLSSQRPHYTG
jgi:hypothetical protein